MKPQLKNGYFAVSINDTTHSKSATLAGITKDYGIEILNGKHWKHLKLA